MENTIEENDSTVEEEVVQLEKPRVKKPRTDKQIQAFSKARERKLENARLRKEEQERKIYEKVASTKPKPRKVVVPEPESESDDESVEYVPKRKCVDFAKPKKKKKKVVVYLSSSDEDDSSEEEEPEPRRVIKKDRIQRQQDVEPEVFNSRNYFC